jgi:hypothetical protein
MKDLQFGISKTSKHSASPDAQTWDYSIFFRKLKTRDFGCGIWGGICQIELDPSLIISMEKPMYGCD